MILGAIFDLDGVLVDTAKYHYTAWKELAEQLMIPFDEQANENLKGVSRVESLDILLALGKKKYSQAEKEQFLRKKNLDYLNLIREMTPEEVLPGVRTVLSFLNNNGIKLAIGSASRNAQTILKATELSDYFDEIVDGNDVENAKPDPEVFFTAAKRISVEPRKCVVFEDSRAGCLAAKTAQMYCVGIGERVKLPEADTVIKGFVDFDMVKIIDA